MHSKLFRLAALALAAIALPATALADRVVIRSPVVGHTNHHVFRHDTHEVRVRNPVQVHEDHHHTRVVVH